MQKNELNWKQRLIDICEILIRYGINIYDIHIKETRDGKRYEVLQEFGRDIQK